MEQNYISTKQLVIITFVMNIVVKFLIAPIILLKLGGRGATAALAVFLAIDILQVIMLSISGNLSGGKTFNEIIECTLGKAGAKIINIILTVYAVVKIAFLITFMKNFISTSLFEGILWAVYSIPLFIVLAVFGMRSYRSLGRLSELVFIFTVAAIIMLLLLVIKNADFISVLPIFGSADNRTGAAIQKLPLWFGDYLLLILYFGRIKKCKRFKTVMLTSVIVSALITFFCCLVFFANYMDSVSFFDYDKKISSITQISVSNISSGRIDKLFFCIALAAIIILAGEYFYFSVRNSEYILGLKRPTKYTSVALAVIVYILTCFILNDDGMIYYITFNVINYIVWAVQITLPVLLLILSAVSRRKQPRFAGVA